jgi:hypothetical protein
MEKTRGASMPRLLLALAFGLPFAASLAAISSLAHTRNEYVGIVHAYRAASEPREEVENVDVQGMKPVRPLQVAEHGC